MKPNLGRGKNERIYFDAEAKELLTSMVVSAGIQKSNVVCALIRAASGGSPRPNEEGVFAMIKRAIGRDQFIAFISAVNKTLPKEAKPVFETKHEHKPEIAPDQWVFGSVGIFAFFAPNNNNIGEVFTRSSLLKSSYCLDRVLVVTTNVDMVDEGARSDMDKAAIHLVSLAEFPETLKRIKKK